MKKFTGILVVVLAMLCFIPFNSAFASIITDSGDAALAGATVIDFEDQTLGVTTSPASLTIGDVAFTPEDRHLRIDNTYSFGYGSVGKYLDNGTYDDMGFFALRIDFSNPTSAFGFQWDMAEPEAIWNLNAYDASNTLLYNYLLPNTDGSPTGAFVGIAANDISYATLINTSPKDLTAGNGIGYDWISIDNFTYQEEGGSVPEPATLLLIGSGLIGLAGFRRKFRES